MKKLIRSIKYLFSSRYIEVERVKLSTGVECVHIKDRVDNIIRIEVE